MDFLSPSLLEQIYLKAYIIFEPLAAWKRQRHPTGFNTRLAGHLCALSLLHFIFLISTESKIDARTTFEKTLLDFFVRPLFRCGEDCALPKTFPPLQP